MSIRRGSSPLLLLSGLFLSMGLVRANGESLNAPNVQVNPQGRVAAYQLEQVEIHGTTRMSREQLVRELGLSPGVVLDDEFVMSTRQRLLSLGLFRSVILVMHKGSSPGKARLMVEVEDDDSVFGTWGLGGEAGITLGESQASQVDVNSPPLGYHFNIIGRNLFNDLHRGRVAWDVDGEGVLRKGTLAYGLPRFTREDIQFDTELHVVDVRARYLDALGFGGRLQALWTHSISDYGEVQYGPAMYVNRGSRFAMPEFPDSIAGAKMGYLHETRLQSFFPGDGALYGASLLLAPTQANYSVVELVGGRTFALTPWLWFTAESQLLGVGVSGYSARGEGRFDVALTPRSPSIDDQANLFLRLRAGSDQWQSSKVFGSAAILGVRYHSAAIIGELSLQITKAPRDFNNDIKSPGTDP